MTVVGISMVRDEADIIEGTIRHMAAEVDHLVVADNLSEDGTFEILVALAKELPLTVIVDADPAYRQSEKMSNLAEHAAAAFDATWIVPFDADELWYAEDRVRQQIAWLEERHPGYGIIEADLYNHFATALDEEGDDLFATIVWRQRDPASLPKVAFKWEPRAVIQQGNHGVFLPSAAKTMSGLQIRHFPYRSADQFVRKARNGAAAYRATDLPVTEGAHWRQYGDLLDRYGESALHDVYRTHFWFLSPVDSGLICDPAPYRRWEQ